MIASMSPPCVDRGSAPRTARNRWIGTDTGDDCLPRALTRTTEWNRRPVRAPPRQSRPSPAAEIVFGRDGCRPNQRGWRPRPARGNFGLGRSGKFDRRMVERLVSEREDRAACCRRGRRRAPASASAKPGDAAAARCGPG